MDPDLVAACDDAVAAARARWPGLARDGAWLRAALARAEVTPTVDAVRARGAELVLAHAAAAGDPVALAAFEREPLRSAAGTMQRYLRDDARVDEALQRLRVDLLVAEPGAVPKVARFDARAPLGAWVCMCAARVALHALRADRSGREVGVEWSDALADLTASDPAIEPVRARYAEQVAAALRDACMELGRRQRAVIRLLFVDGAGVDDVAAVYQVHRVTVWRWAQEAQAQLREGVRARLRQAVPERDAGTATLIAWVEDQVMLSLDQALAPTATDARPR